MSTTGWESTLHRLAQHLAEQRGAVERAELGALEAFVPEHALGPLPPELAARLRELHAESVALEHLLREALARTSAALGSGPSSARTGCSPSFVDSRV